MLLDSYCGVDTFRKGPRPSKRSLDGLEAIFTFLLGTEEIAEIYSPSKLVVKNKLMKEEKKEEGKTERRGKGRKEKKRKTPIFYF